MKNKLFFIKFGGYVFVSLLGTLFHFLYDLTEKNVLFAPFTAVNESIFQHMKLLYFPLLLWTVIEIFIFKGEYKNFYSAKAKAFTVGLFLIPILYYTYTGALGIYADWFNILIFFISGAAAFIVDTVALKSNKKCAFSQTVYIIYILVLGVIFVILTFFPIKIPLFLDRHSKKYGI